MLSTKKFRRFSNIVISKANIVLWYSKHFIQCWLAMFLHLPWITMLSRLSFEDFFPPRVASGWQNYVKHQICLAILLNSVLLSVFYPSAILLWFHPFAILTGFSALERKNKNWLAIHLPFVCYRPAIRLRSHSFAILSGFSAQEQKK